MKRGTASFKYHSVLERVLKTIFDNTGIRSGGISNTKSELSPFNTFEDKYPTKKITSITENAQTSVAVKETPPSIPRITPSCAEHGTPRARRSVTITLSFLVSITLAVNVAIVSQPSPSTIGRTAFPCSPISLNILCTIMASLGRYPESSSMPNAMKKVPTMGSMSAME